MTRFPKLAGLAEVASLAGVSRTRAGQLSNHPDFPEPVDRLAMGPVWRESDVVKFLATPRKPGRRPKGGKRYGIDVVVDDTMPPGTIGLVSIGRDGDGCVKASTAWAYNIGSESKATP